MEYKERHLNNPESKQPFIHPYEYEQASNSYLMAVVGVAAGLPLPIVNVFAGFIYYLAHRKSSYLVRWHSIQAVLGQLLLIPFNSVAFAWTIGILFRSDLVWQKDHIEEFNLVKEIPTGYWLYLFFIILLNITEFIIVIYTASKVRKGHNIRWFGIATITDSLCSKEDRNPYKL